MNLKNYTSSVSAVHTIGRIEQLLAQAGTNGVVKEFSNGRVLSLTFTATLPNSKTVSIRLPANVQAVYVALRKKVKRPHPGTDQRLLEQAERTAWKLMQDWVEVQLSLIAMQQAEFLQVFLPYVYDGRRSFFDSLKSNDFKALMPAKQMEVVS